MNTMPGNPHADAAQPVYYSHQTHEQVQESLVYTQREATLALAYEQRTANLIAVAVAQDQRGVVGDRYWEEVAERLGLGGETSE